MVRQAIRKIRHDAAPARDEALSAAERLDLSQHLDALLDASFDGFVVADAQARILKVNGAYTRITGLTEAALVGQKLGDLVRSGQLQHSVTLEVIKHRIPVTMLHSYQTGKVGLVTGTPVFDRDGNLALVIANVRDITQLNKLRERLGETPMLGDLNASIFLSAEFADLPTFNLVIHNDRMRRCLASALKVAKYESPVLILGESGVGKGRFAKLIHDASPRRAGPFVHLNCGAIPENLVESELFGYERGAFTGALPAGKPGQFEAGHNGTIFLDEIAELGLNLQVKLLNVIEDKAVQRLGSRQSIPVDVRLIAATNRDVETMVREGKFREDLYFRLNVVPLKIPPLRERTEEIPLMIQAFLDALGRKYGARKRLAPRVVRALTEYHYPGNVRELENILERLVILSEGDEIDHRHLALCAFELSRPEVRVTSRKGETLRKNLDAVEAQLLREGLARSRTMRDVAADLGVSVPTLWRKLRKHQLHADALSPE